MSPADEGHRGVGAERDHTVGESDAIESLRGISGEIALRLLLVGMDADKAAEVLIDGESSKIEILVRAVSVSRTVQEDGPAEFVRDRREVSPHLGRIARPILDGKRIGNVGGEDAKRQSDAFQSGDACDSPGDPMLLAEARDDRRQQDPRGGHHGQLLLPRECPACRESGGARNSHRSRKNAVD